jgi:very-short-patch-repair endonuclease
MTHEELILWKLIKSKQLGFWFKRQVSIGPYFIDFYCPQKHLAIEVDGNYHKTTEQKEYDSYRTKYLTGLNIKVIRFWNYEVNNEIKTVISKINTAINIPSP